MVLSALIQKAENGYVMTIANSPDESRTYVFPSLPRAAEFLLRLNGSIPTSNEAPANDQERASS